MLDIDERQRGPFVTDLLHMFESNTVAGYARHSLCFFGAGARKMRLVRKEAEMNRSGVDLSLGP